MKNKKFYGDDIPSVRKSKKPLPGLLSDNSLFKVISLPRVILVTC